MTRASTRCRNATERTDRKRNVRRAGAQVQVSPLRAVHAEGAIRNRTGKAALELSRFGGPV